MSPIDDIFSQIIGQQSSGQVPATGASDLNAFNSTILATDPFGIAGRSLASWQPNYSSFSPVESGVTSFSKSFLSGLLGEVARGNAADQLAKVAAVFPELQNNPANVAVPEDVDAGAFNTLKLSQAEKKQTSDEAIRRALATTLGVNYDPITGTVSKIASSDSASDLPTLIAGLAQEKRRALEDKPLSDAAIQRMAAGTSALGQLNKAKDLINQFTPNPELGGLTSIPVLGPYLGELAGGTLRGVQETRNTTPEGKFLALMQSVNESTGKFISNSARQKIIDENNKLIEPGKTGSPEGIKTAIQNIQDIIAQDLLDQASGFGEQHYSSIKGAVDKALQYQSSYPTSAPPPPLPNETLEQYKIRVRGLQ